ncbi:conserved hypothetical protein [Parafrankia sp. EAN1pec]|uniref:hypothetical protein n=1 Tax=Parafrankia sp. (strain EAN1pec) TaxID=298653 RepID=UPI0000543F41|nr:conserved hypothetical protein [Frankia sp. EAN1pec]
MTTTATTAAASDAAATGAPEAAWHSAPGLLDGAKTLRLGPEQCGIAYWIDEVAQGTLRDRGARGHRADAAVPPFLRRPGPLHEALVLEFTLRSLAEQAATRLLAHYVASAPGVRELEFYVTQLVDEARHCQVFRDHVAELGPPSAALARELDRTAADYARLVLEPVVAFTLDVVRDKADFVGGVAIFAVVIEGVLAPAAELSERKWTPLSPATQEVSRGTAIDEIRHLTVASTILRDHVTARPQDRPRLAEIIRSGVRLWDEIPDRQFVMYREELFQQGMHEQAELIGDYEIWPGVRLLDTTAAQRYDMADQWTNELAQARLPDLGLPADLLACASRSAR